MFVDECKPPESVTNQARVTLWSQGRQLRRCIIFIGVYAGLECRRHGGYTIMSGSGTYVRQSKVRDDIF